MLFDFETMKISDRYKLVVASVVPRPIAWLVTQDEGGRVNAAPFSFFNVFSDDPVIVGIGIGPRGPGGGDDMGRKDSLANILAIRQFTLCLVSEANAAAMNVTAADFPPGVDELAEAGLTAAPCARVRTPRIAESPVALECELHDTVPLGRHHLVLGRVVAAHIHDDCMLNVEKHYVDTPRLGLIGRMHGGGWYARTTDRFDMPRVTPEKVAARKAGG